MAATFGIPSNGACCAFDFLAARIPGGFFSPAIRHEARGTLFV